MKNRNLAVMYNKHCKIGVHEEYNNETKFSDRLVLDKHCRPSSDCC